MKEAKTKTQSLAGVSESLIDFTRDNKDKKDKGKRE